MKNQEQSSHSAEMSCDSAWTVTADRGRITVNSCRIEAGLMTGEALRSSDH